MNFDSPNEAAAALLAAMEAGDYGRFLSIAGPPMASFWNTGDPERDSFERERLLDAARRRGIKIAARGGDRGQLYLGDLPQPFPAPLVKTASGWRFDGDAGAQEVAARRIRRNELAAVELCRRLREAQFAYLERPRDGDAAFAQKIRSTPGRHDGLFWSGPGEEDQSPLGPTFAAAAFAERQPAESPRPLLGYYIRILPSQGLRKGFALIAWPAEYGIDGVRSFLMNHLGDVYQNDLGPATGRTAERMTVFSPDRGWSRVFSSDN